VNQFAPKSTTGGGLRPLLSLAATIGAGLFATSVAAMPMQYDVNDTGTNNTQSGWTAVDLNGGNNVTFTSVGGTVLADRDRNNANTNDGGDTANNGMWRDFIFADERSRNGASVTDPSNAGMNIAVSNLLAGTLYEVTLWAFDEVSNGGRHMTWNGNALTIPDGPDRRAFGGGAGFGRAVDGPRPSLSLTSPIRARRGLRAD
jgi:hypothetical protein